MLQMVGPLLTADAKPLSQDLDAFLQQGLKNTTGAIYVSMGTLAKLSKAEVQSLAQAFRAISNPVLWKLDSLPGWSLLQTPMLCHGLLPSF